MGKRTRRHSGGNIRKLPSGRYQVRVRDRTTNRLESLGTFPTKADADVALSRAVADQSRGAWVAPERGRIALRDFAARWMAEHPSLAARTRERYDGLLRLHILPELGATALSDLTPSGVRAWHARLQQRASRDTAAKAYRLLRGIMNTAVADELIHRNPCTVKGAGIEEHAECPIATVAEVQELADAVPPRFRVLVLIAAFCSLRFGELAALTRGDVDLMHGTIRVRRNRQRLDDGTSIVVEPKSEAGRRTVGIPPPLIPDLEGHLAAYAAPGRDGLVFVGEQGAPLDRSHWNRRWRKARASIGREDRRFHDLRHTGNTLAAATGASTRELMSRMGQSSARAALIYQHATEDREKAIAAALGELIEPADIASLGERRGAQ